MKVSDVNPNVKGNVRCKCCDNVMSLSDVLISGDSPVCPICGEYARFIDEMDGSERDGMTELKPCPSCGSPLTIKTYIPAGKVYVCKECGWKKRKYEYDKEVKE